MKRKSSRRSEKSDEDENEVGVDEEVDSSEEPQEKKGRKSKGKKSKSKHVETESELETGQSEEDEAVAPQENGSNEQKRGRKPKGRKSKQSKKDNSDSKDTGQSEEEDDEPVKGKENGNNQEKKGRKSRGKKSKADEDTESTEETDPLAGDNDAEYEVEAILGDKMMKGVKHYLIRWKGYTEESDTWEPEETLDCQYLIDAYKEKNKKEKSKKGIKKVKKDEENVTWDENEDFEVDRIIDVYFHKNGKRDFLVSWKGYPASQNSWEPEDNMDCKDLINKFMEKVSQAKKFEAKEAKLRVNPKPVNRLEFSMHERSRRLSKRRGGKDRVHYFDAE